MRSAHTTGSSVRWQVLDATAYRLSRHANRSAPDRSSMSPGLRCPRSMPARVDRSRRAAPPWSRRRAAAALPDFGAVEAGQLREVQMHATSRCCSGAVMITGRMEESQI